MKGPWPEGFKGTRHLRPKLMLMRLKWRLLWAHHH